MKAGEYTFAALFAIEGSQWHYHVPRLQREYVWKKNYWNNFLEDIYDNDPGHFVDSIICVSKADKRTQSSELTYEVLSVSS